MKKRVLALAAAAVMTLTAVAPVSAAMPAASADESNYIVTEANAVAAHLMGNYYSTILMYGVEPSDDVEVDNVRAYTSGQRTDMQKALGHLLYKGKVNGGNGVTQNGAVVDIEGADIQAKGKGDVTFNTVAEDGNAVYLIHIHNGVADYDLDFADEDGKVTFGFSKGFSPVLLVVTNQGKRIAPDAPATWEIPDPASEDAKGASKTTTTAAAAGTAAGTAAAGTTAGAAGASAGASPKTSDSNTLYVLFAMAAVAGTAVVATKKSR